eukprot:347947-Chlamydomonas_euryale.AAC.1
MCWDAVDLDDACARGVVALKLALLLEESAGDAGAGGAAGGLTPAAVAARAAPLYEARDVLERCRGALVAARCGAVSMQAGAPDEHMRWITASRSQPSDAAAELVAGAPAGRCGQRGWGARPRDGGWNNLR